MARDAWRLILEGIKETSLKNELYLLESPSVAWQYLYNKYSPNSAQEQYSLELEFRNAALAPGEGPLKFMWKLQNIADRLGEVNVPLHPCTIISEFLHSLDRDYEAEFRSIRNSGKTGDWDFIENVVRDRFVDLSAKRRQKQVKSAGGVSQALVAQDISRSSRRGRWKGHRGRAVGHGDGGSRSGEKGKASG
ncbi:unnamed protein product, partial [Discosporangium mesarthrocarpum]